MYTPQPPPLVAQKAYYHWDWLNWPILGFSHRQGHNIKGGSFHLTDFKQMMADKGLWWNAFVASETHDGLTFSFAKLPPSLEAEAKEKYSLDFECGNIILVNNTYPAGILHGPNDSKRVDETQPASRLLHHSAFTVQSRKKQSQRG